MKSERAKQFIKTQSSGDIAQYEVSLWKAKKAVEIAEEEMREAAIEAFRSVHCSNCKKEFFDKDFLMTMIYFIRYKQ